MPFNIDENLGSFSFDPKLMNALDQGLTGSAPSQAEVMRRKAFDEAMRRSMGIVRSNRNQSAAAGTRQGLQAQSALQTEGAQQATQLRAQEYQNAVAQMLAQQQAAQQGYYQQQQLQQQAAMFNAQQDQAFAGSIMNMVGSMGGAAMSAFGSDKRLKDEIKDASDKDMTEFMQALKAKTYKYKQNAPAGVIVDKDNKKGEMGILAQDLEKTKLGKRLVQDVQTWKEGKAKKGEVAPMVKGPMRKEIRKEALGAALGAIGHLAQKVEDLETELATALAKKSKK